jgi:hypothetical protein
MARPAEKCGHTIIALQPIRHNSPLDMPRASLSESHYFKPTQRLTRIRNLSRLLRMQTYLRIENEKLSAKLPAESSERSRLDSRRQLDQSSKPQ